VHVHTDHPGLVLENAGKFGMFATVKIENMRKQHSAIVSDKAEPKKVEIAAPEKKFGFVSVCMGNGIKDTFIDIGADNIIFGGQTMNPSTQDIIDGVNKTPAEIVYVLPNNKNIYLVAKQAAKLVKDKKVVVLETRSVPQGICAMLAFDPEADEETNTTAMQEAAVAVTSMSVTHAVRDTTIGGEKIEDGQMLGMVDGAINCVADTPESCIEKLTEKMVGAFYITVFYGEEVTEEQAEKTVAIIKSAVPDAEIVCIPGGQPIYSYIISVEK
jgi:dihydroxyacetone kinase-like predicted kinase